MERWHAVNSSQMLGFICAAGVLVCALRFRRSDFRAHLVAFGLVLLGTALRESVVHWASSGPWSDAQILASALARDVQIAGAVLFVRAVTQPRCGEWVWAALTAAGVIFATVVQ